MIKFEGVTFVHEGGVVALNNVRLEVSDGETVAVVGENGAGKTTLIKHVTGLLKPTKGKVWVDGEDTTKKTIADLSRKVGIAFQNPDHQLFSESVEEEIMFGLRNFGFAPDRIAERVDWALEFFALQEYRKSSPLTLSGGEKKRLTLGCILSWDPKMVILDEPTVGQDAFQKEKLVEVIRSLRATGKTVILVSHDIEFLWPLQPRLVVMSRGEIVQDGPAFEVMQNRELLETARVLQPQLVRLYQRMSRRPESPFIDYTSASKWVSGLVSR